VRFHREFGVALAARLRAGDRAIVLAAPAAAQAIVQGAASPVVVPVADISEARACFESFAGSVFIKGSRRYQLESLLVSAGETVVSAH
jgi:UDP-N-acetylmuramoyl-tripeptide--D-alanyl-D-alanine ligase